MTDKTTKATTALVEAAAPKSDGLCKAECKDGVLTITAGQRGIDEMAAALGGCDTESLQSLLVGELVNVLTPKGKEDATFSLLAGVEAVQAIGPRNPAEAMLAVQMVAAHHLALDLMTRASNSDRVDFMDRYANMATKFSRTFLAQMEGLAKLRRNGEQVVKHVHVNEGGQAVIAGTVHTGGGGRRDD